MKAVRRFVLAWLAWALALGPAMALAQAVPPPASTNAPAPDTVGPRDLQNFTLNGTVTRPADTSSPAQAPAARRPSRAEAQPAPAPAETPTATAATAPPRSPPAERPEAKRVASAQGSAPTEAPPQTAHVSAPTPSPVAQADPGPPPAQAATPGFAPDPLEPVGTLAPEHHFPLLPWLLAALALGAGGAFLFWRNRSREAFAGGPQVDAYVAPEPAPAPRPAPAPPPRKAPPAPQPSTAGIVSTRLRPWIDIGFRPLRCILDDERVTLEFEIELFNSGSAPARAVLVEASLINAGPTQERDLGAFFANPVGEGDRIPVIPPLQRFGLKTKVSTPRHQVQAYELGGRQVFVPVIAFNTLYGWSSGEGQSSAAYLLGRDTKGDKMAPFRLDLGPRVFRGLAAHLLPGGVRD
jgi:hypothetical protein